LRAHLVFASALAAGVLAAASGLPGRPALAADVATRFVGPTDILFADADSAFLLRSLAWHSAAVRHQEKLLLHSLRMRYWRDHIPSDMRRVFDALGYPASRVIHTPVGHTEEWWHYGLLDPPLRFRDGALLDGDRFEALLSR
jgi:hypothetical protein